MRLAPEHGTPLAEAVRARQGDLEAENAALRQKQVLLESAKAHYLDLFELAPAGYCTVGAQGVILQANRAARAMLGVENTALVDARILQFIAEADRALFALHCQRAAGSAETQSCELRMMHVQRGQFWAHLQSATAQDADGAPELRILLSDVTARKDGEAATAAATAAAAGASQGGNMADLAKTVDLTESQLRSEISHELRQPLSALAIYASVLKNHVAPAGQPLLAQIKTCLATLSELLAK